MAKIKVPARIKQNQLEGLTQYFSIFNADKAKAIFGTNNTRIVETLDGTGYWVKYVFKDFGNSYLHFSKAKKTIHGTYTFL